MDNLEKELYTIIIVGFSLAFILVVFIVTIVFLYQRRKHRHEQTLSALAAQYQEEMLKSQLEIQEETMKSLAQELHDNIGQMLSVVKMSLAILPIEAEHPALEPMQSVKTNLNQAILDLSNLTKSLHSDRIHMIGLIDAIRFELNNIAKANLIEIEMDLDEQLIFDDPDKIIIIYRMFQELLNNVLKHSKASILKVYARRINEHLIIKMEDNGMGFDLEAKKNSASATSGVGLRSIFNRAKLINAELKYDTGIGRGTIVTILLPLPHNIEETEN